MDSTIITGTHSAYFEEGNSSRFRQAILLDAISISFKVEKYWK
jgi:hypothetical protein